MIMANTESIEELHKRLSGFSYGTIYGSFPHDYRSVEPAVFAREKKGVCFDYVAYQADYFKKNYPGIKYDLFYFETNFGEFCHTFMLYKNLGVYNIFEACMTPKEIISNPRYMPLMKTKIYQLLDIAKTHRGDNFLTRHRAPYVLYKYKAPQKYGLYIDGYMEYIYHTGELIKDNDNYLKRVIGC